MSLIQAINRPASETMGNEIYIGPTAVDFSMLPDKGSGRVPHGEAARLKSWSTQTANFHARRSNRPIDLSPTAPSF